MKKRKARTGSRKPVSPELIHKPRKRGTTTALQRVSPGMPAENSLALQPFTGQTPDLTRHFLLQATLSQSVREDMSDAEENVNTTRQLLAGVKSGDSLNDLLSVQMVATHNLAMEFVKRSLISDDIRYGLAAGRLMQLFAVQLEANRNQISKQTGSRMTVENVHINGGQNIVGPVGTEARP